VRKAKGWTLKMAAQEVDCNISTLSLIETAQRAPSRAMAVDIIYGYQLDHTQAQMLMAESVGGAGRSKPSRRKALKAAA
jgi:hypothetical protein